MLVTHKIVLTREEVIKIIDAWCLERFRETPHNLPMFDFDRNTGLLNNVSFNLSVKDENI